MVYLLVVAHSRKDLVGDSGIVPFDMPVLGLLEVFDLPIETLMSADFKQNGVLGAFVIERVLVRLMIAFVVCPCFIKISLSMLVYFL
jgi:hypothetical protein